MPKKKLKHQWIRSKECEEATTYYDETESGLMLRVLKSGKKSFSYRYNLHGKKYRYSIGLFPSVSVAEARKEVRRCKRELREGNDPLAKKHTEPKTFEQLAEKFIEHHLPTLREGTAKEYKRIIKNDLLPELGGYRIGDISKDVVLKLLKDKARARGKYKGNDPAPTMANRIRARLSTMFNYGIKEEGLTKGNPVEGTSKFKAGENNRARWYKPDEIRNLWAFFNDLQPATGGVLKMLLVCGQRKTETMKMRWDDINGDIWTIPANLAKNGKKHDVPLPDIALDIIGDMKPITGETDYVFASPKAENAPLKWLTRARRNIQKYCVSDFRPHDLRRSVATHMAQIGVQQQVVGKILNHKAAGKDNTVTAIYNRYEYQKEKRQALNRWSHKLQQIIEGNEEAKIHKIA